MAFVPTSGAWELKLNFNDAFKTYSNVLHVLSGGGTLDVGAAGLIRTAVEDASSGSGLFDFLNDTVGLSNVTITDIRTEGAPQFQLSVAADGTDATDLLPNGVAAVLTLRTAFRDKSGRGRIYMGGWAEVANETGGTMAGAAVTALEAWGASLIAELESAGHALGVVSKRHNKADLNPRIIREVTSAQVRNPQWDTQRRRQHTTS